jgi:hypothetical protein
MLEQYNILNYDCGLIRMKIRWEIKMQKSKEKSGKNVSFFLLNFIDYVTTY